MESDAPRVGIDIGGTSAKLGLVAPDGRILRRARVPTGREGDGDALVARLAAAVAELRAGAAPARLGVAAPGCRRPDGEGVINVTNLPQIDGYPLRRRLEEATGLPTTLENDANAAAMGEARFGAGRGVRRVLVVTVGTGIGAGMVVDGAVLRVAWEGLGDPGHVVVQAEGPRCFCGGRGCAESLAAVPAMLRRAAALGYAGPVEFGALVAAARAGEEPARRAIEEAGGWLGVALVSLVHVLAPDRLLLGGGGTDAAGELLFDPARRAFARHVQPFLAERVQLARAALGNDAGLVGAAARAG